MSNETPQSQPDKFIVETLKSGGTKYSIKIGDWVIQFSHDADESVGVVTLSKGSEIHWQSVYDGEQEPPLTDINAGDIPTPSKGQELSEDGLSRLIKIRDVLDKIKEAPDNKFNSRHWLGIVNQDLNSIIQDELNKGQETKEEGDPKNPQIWPDLDYNKPPRTDYPQEGKEEQSDKLPEYIQEEMRNIDEIESALVEEILEEFQKIGIDTSEWEQKFGDGNFAAEFIAAGIKYHLEQLAAPKKQTKKRPKA